MPYPIPLTQYPLRESRSTQFLSRSHPIPLTQYPLIPLTQYPLREHAVKGGLSARLPRRGDLAVPLIATVAASCAAARRGLESGGVQQ